jgi:hypothetical protein
MTAEQIRSAKFECDDGLWECARWLQELAAQLAELNERLTPGNLEVNIYDCSFDGANKAGQK